MRSSTRAFAALAPRSNAPLEVVRDASRMLARRRGLSHRPAGPGLRVIVVMPEGTPQVIVREASAYGADVYLVPGSIADAGAAVRDACAKHGWYDASTLHEPYRIEGKKTMGFELAEQLGWRVPDVIVYPTGGGVGLIGMWTAFDELRALGSR